jgi:hypothetical protein
MDYDQKSVLYYYPKKKKKKKSIFWEMSVEWETLVQKIASLG